MAEFNDFLNLISEAKKEAEETTITPKSTVKEDAIFSFFESINISLNPAEEIVDQPQIVEQEIVEQKIEPIVEKLDLTDPTQYTKLFKTNTDHFSQPNAPKVDPNFKALTDKVKYMEDWLTKISMAGPGSGEVNLRWLDDIDRSSIQNGRYLKYNAHLNKFVFSNPALNELGVVDYLQLNTSGPGITPDPGTLSWNPTEDCLNVTQNDGSTLQVGLENYIQVHNHTGSLLTNGSVVKFSGVDPTIPDLPLCALMTADYTAQPLYLIGVLTNDIAHNSFGRATILGRVHDLNTTGSDVGETWNVGDILWVHPSIPGKLTRVKPTLPQVAISVAAVVKKHATSGTLLVRPTIWPRLLYGVFSNTVDHNPVAINTAYPINIDTTNTSSGFSVAANSHIVASESGLYNFAMSAQLSSTNSSAKQVYFWVKKNDQDVAYSTRSQTVNGNGTRATFACNWTISMNSGDYVELMWAVDDITIRLDATPATAFCPETPSVLITVTQPSL